MNNPAQNDQDLEVARKQLELAFRELEKFERIKPLASAAAAVVHDIRNSLGVIASTAQFVLKSLSPSEKEKQAWMLVERNVETIQKILKGYLGLAKQTQGKKESVSLNEIVDRVCHFIDVQAKSRRIKVERSLEPSIPAVVLDVSAIESAVLNITINAIDAMPSGGVLKFLSKAAHGQEPPSAADGLKRVSLEIADTGHGIPQEALGKLFTPFYTTKDQGTGMGLYSAKASVEQNGGEIACESKPGGTTFTLSFPVNAPPQGVQALS